MSVSPHWGPDGGDEKTECCTLSLTKMNLLKSQFEAHVEIHRTNSGHLQANNKNLTYLCPNLLVHETNLEAKVSPDKRLY